MDVKAVMSNKTWATWLKLVVISIGVSSVFLVVVYSLIAVNMVHSNATSIAELQAEIRMAKQWRQDHEKVTQARLDYIESVLFGDVVAKIQAQRAQRASELKATPEWWMRRDAENRKLIQDLQWKVFVLENQR